MKKLDDLMDTLNELIAFFAEHCVLSHCSYNLIY